MPNRIYLTLYLFNAPPLNLQTSGSFRHSNLV
nr:MAG TPA: hypothetical protein [Caudoviricetes sp.]